MHIFHSKAIQTFKFKKDQLILITVHVNFLICSSCKSSFLLESQESKQLNFVFHAESCHPSL